MKEFSLFLIILHLSFVALETCRKITVRNLESEKYVSSETLNKTKEFELELNTNIKDKNHAISIKTELITGNNGGSDPILYFNVGQAGIMKSWKVSASSKHAEHVMCALPGPQKIRFYAWTSSNYSQSFRLTVSTYDYELHLNQPKDQVQLRVNASRVYHFKFPEEKIEEHFILKVTNFSQEMCSIISIQNASTCPHEFRDQESNIQFGSSYQTMLQKSAMIVSRSQYPNGFNVVLLGKSDTSACYKKTPSPSLENLPTTSNVSILVSSMQKGILSSDLVLDSIILVFAFYFSLAVFFFILTFVLDKCFNFEMEGMYGTVEAIIKRKERKRMQESGLRNVVPLTLVVPQDDVDASHVHNNHQHEHKSEKEPRWVFPWQEKWKRQDEQFYETEHVEDVDGYDRASSESRTQPRVSLARSNVACPDTSTRKSHKNCQTLDKTCTTISEHHRQTLRSELFSWLIIVAGIFYGLPAFQMVFNHQNPFIQGGDQDICYYNFFCIFPYGKFADFGHVFSNIGYIISGLYFIFKVYVRKLKFEKISNKLTSTGIPEQTGIFYALGGALILEGVLSGIYHICPTSSNFQFDTTFMFFIAVLIFLKLYQFRHVDTTMTAQLVFLLIGVVLTLEVIGYFTSHPAFWVAFILTYMFFLFVFILKIYLNEKKFKKVFSMILTKMLNCCSCEKVSFNYKDLIPCTIVIIINIIMATFFAISQRPGVSRYLLAILMVNMMCYEVYYVGKKIYYRLRRTNWRENEGIRPITLIYLMMSFGFMLGACYFFAKELKTSAGTPAESRNKNADCALLIFDNHDIWHFLSAAGLYQHFMFLLTLEDYNIGYMKDRRFITVF